MSNEYVLGLTFHALSTAQRDKSYFCRYTPMYIIERVKGSSAVHKFDLFPDDVTSLFFFTDSFLQCVLNLDRFLHVLHRKRHNRTGFLSVELYKQSFPASSSFSINNSIHLNHSSVSTGSLYICILLLLRGVAMDVFSLHQSMISLCI